MFIISCWLDTVLAASVWRNFWQINLKVYWCEVSGVRPLLGAPVSKLSHLLAAAWPGRGQHPASRHLSREVATVAPLALHFPRSAPHHYICRIQTRQPFQCQNNGKLQITPEMCQIGGRWTGACTMHQCLVSIGVCISSAPPNDRICANIPNI